uniref:HAT C-terminal dimerisation domain-containing protein n=1 Tax=Phytophthora ramorum TaxID=164328 RepID=H3H9K3_PHYRM
MNGKRRERLLALSPIEESSQEAERIATLLELPLVGCASHRYNLAVNRYLTAYETELAALNHLMVQLRHCNHSAELANFTDLVPIKRNMTRWSSTFEMVLRYKRIRDVIRQVADDYPVMVNHLGLGAKIVHTPVNEAALVKIGNGRKLNASEARSVQRFVVEPEASAGKRKERSDDNYASDILQGRKQPRNACATSISYDPLTKVVPPTSNTVERLFSQCKLLLTPQRTCMLPANFEMLAFLRANRDLWNASLLVDSE